MRETERETERRVGEASFLFYILRKERISFMVVISVHVWVLCEKKCKKNEKREDARRNRKKTGR